MKIIYYIISISILFGAGDAFARVPKTRLKFQSFSSRKAVERKLGKKVASQIPGYFDFRKYKLIFLPRDYNEDAKLELIEPKKGPDQRSQIEQSRWIVLRLLNTHFFCADFIPLILFDTVRQSTSKFKIKKIKRADKGKRI